MLKKNYPKFGDIFFASLSSEGHVQGGVRPVVIAQNNVGNMYSPTIGVIPMSSRTEKAKHLPVHVTILADQNNGLKTDSVVLTEQTRTIPEEQLLGSIGSISHDDLVRIKRALDIQFPFPLS